MKWFGVAILTCFLAACSRGPEPEAAAEVSGPSIPPDSALKAVAELPVLHGGGRVMPLDTFSRLVLLQISGRKGYGEETALEWMMRVLMFPESGLDDTIFLVEHPDVLSDMNVPLTQEIEGKRKPSTRRFSYNHLRPGLAELQLLAGRARNVPEDDRGRVEREALRLFENIMLYNQFRQTFAFAQTVPGLEVTSPEVLEALELQEGHGPVSFLHLRQHTPQLIHLVEEATDAETLTAVQTEAFAVARFVREAESHWTDLPLPLLPEAPHGTDHFVAPYDALTKTVQDQDLVNAGRRSLELFNAWRSQDWENVKKLSGDITAFTRARMDHLRESALTGYEARFNRANYFGKAKVYYLFAFFLALGSVVSGSHLWRKAAWVPLAFGLLLHVVGLGWRIYLTARPPVTNLYGTFLFVSLMCVLLAILVEALVKNGLGLFVGSLIAVTFLFLADRYIATGDTMGKVVAVLASNFWLSTHVLAVTTGYAGVWIAGVFGHLWLIFKLLGKDKESLKLVHLIMEGLLGFGLTFAFLGTMLGGVWADQSWGRFWGWDPKENGALLIVLWTAAVYHARIGGLIKETGMAMGAVAGCIMVMVAWLGVNLLSVGLHSYGFTDTMLNLFVGYIVVECAFMLVMGVLLHLREGPKTEAPETSTDAPPPLPDSV